ncbi:phosphatase 2C-like domain-containing protein, partial [Catenaria anguillulae PL171]
PPPPPTLVFSHHALGYAKRSPVRLVPVPTDHQWKATSAGEDAFFSRFNALGVCDGVGGWQGQENANAGLFARKLMHYCSAELDERPRATFGVGGNTGGVFPQEVLERAYHKTMDDAQREGFVGSTTALLALLTNGNELRIANLGDCGLVVIRQGEFVFRTEEQVHSFNYPYQLGTAAQDTPALAHAFALHAHHGDILVMASDGVWDNVFEEDVLRIVREHVGRTCQPTSHCRGDCANGQGAGEDTRGASPFQSRALREGLYYQGGKTDDIAVVVAVVRD